MRCVRPCGWRPFPPTCRAVAPPAILRGASAAMRSPGQGEEKMIKRTQTPRLLPRPSERHQAPIRECSQMPHNVVAHTGDTHWVGDTWSRAGPWGPILHGTSAQGRRTPVCQGQAQGDKVGWAMKRAHGHQAWSCGSSHRMLVTHLASTAGCREGLW